MLHYRTSGIQQSRTDPGPVFSYKLRYIVGFWLVEMSISTNQNPTIYRTLYENTAPVVLIGSIGAGYMNIVIYVVWLVK